MIRWKAGFAYPIVFCAGFVFFLLEITAGRLLAPAVGLSLETWTGIIGVVLAGQAIGDTVGGRLIDRHPTPRLLGTALVLGGVLTLTMPLLAVAARGLWPAAPLMVRVTAAAALMFLVPSMMLAAVSPMGTRLALRAVEGTGRTVGTLSALSTVGSVLGVALGGFLLLEDFGVRAIVLSSGIGLVALGALTASMGMTDEAGQAVHASAPPLRDDALLTAEARWMLYVLPCVSGGAIMATELAGARLAAILFGTSLYTWASTIGIVLLGISVGTAIGGWLADRYPTRTLLSLVLLIAAGATASMLGVMYAYGTVWPAGVQRILATVQPAVSLPLMFAGLLLPTSMAFGAVTPITIRLLVRRVSDSGQLVGRAYAAQAVGSIAGTFATGFVLISHVGTREVILLVAAATLVAAALVATPSRPRVGLVMRVTTASVLLATGLLSATGRIPSPCYRESNYYCIRVRRQGPDVKWLTLDNLVHTYVNLKSPGTLIYEYEQVFAMTAAELAALRNRPPRVLLIGGGGYAFPRYVTQVYAGATMHVVEIDAAVTETAYDELGLSRSAPIRTWNEDGRQFFLRDRGLTYDLIIGDAFRDAYSVPYHLTTREFATMVSDALEPGGIFGVNVIDGPSAAFIRSYVRTLQAAFRHVYLVPVDRRWRENPQITSVILASNEPIDIARLTRRRPSSVPDTTEIFALSGEELSEFLHAGESMLLTDDRAPVENLLARVYAQSVKRRGVR